MKPTSGTLEITTPSDREILITRPFDAPRHLVFEAYTTPALVKRWLGVWRHWSLAVCEIDLRVGGSYRYVWQGHEGESMGMSGVYREIVAPERIVCTEVFDQAWYEGECLNRIELIEHEGRTILHETLLYASKQVRDGVLASPMETGLIASYDNLAALLAESISRR
ncbi:SRPBCC family protein [Nannocystaceae bacterium ST9]